MTDTQHGIVLLLKSAITGEPYPLPQGFHLEAAISIAKAQQITPLLHCGAANCGIDPNCPGMQQLFMGYISALQKSELQLRQIRRITQAFQAAGIDHMPLKGCNMKLLYPKPELRPMGDADILIRMEQYEKIIPIMQQLGFTAGRESEHELVWKSSELYLELHKHLIPPSNADYYTFFGDGWRLARPLEGNRFGLEPEDDFVFQFTHFARHYRSGGAGCRYMLDLWVFLRTHPALDIPRIRQSLAALQLAEFFDNVSALMGWWFGGQQPTAVAEFLAEAIFSGGAFGDRSTHDLSLELKRSLTAGSFRKSKFQYKLRVLFPPAQVMGKRWPVLLRHRWLTPFFWPVRWITAVLFRRENIRREQKFQEFQNDLTPRDLENRRKALQYVGLDFPMD